MSKLTHLFFSFIFIYSVLAQTDTDFVDKLCEIGFNYTSDSTFGTNLDRALAILPTTNSGYGFFNSSSGRNRTQPMPSPFAEVTPKGMHVVIA
ncbi:hypothetical protein HanXRQr2_Chr05g0194191 [Helianthus annuus]|uniref:Uncharacterized protein n=1 Tax=Helianthus annuus TaxID=4232 RepID=A0A9K3IWD6_HELAN|nr:hypothetical protein HanXRQr2_Chr05g0194191 [Helianthus annuus]